jgi:eukaryotic-like serine/threonine-protein kinase
VPADPLQAAVLLVHTTSRLRTVATGMSLADNPLAKEVPMTAAAITDTPIASPFLGMRYRIDSVLGRGAMGTVYKAEHIGLRMTVALKVLDPKLAETNLDARFEREARTAARLRHPSCVRVLDYGKTVERQRYIAMDWLEGPTLAAEMANRGPLPTSEAVRIASEILKALAHAHRQGVLHRDIKPENIMATVRDGARRWVVIDFGLARLVDDSPLTAAGFCFGSPSYLAPERLLGRRYDARADLYAVGVLLYELLAGARPFAGRTIEETALAHIKKPPPPLRLMRPDVAPALAAIVNRALAKHPHARYRDAEAMLSALSRVPVAWSQPAGAPQPRADEAPTTVLAQIRPASAPLGTRLWSWMRYGRWRWRAPSPALAAATSPGSGPDRCQHAPACGQAH